MGNQLKKQIEDKQKRQFENEKKEKENEIKKYIKDYKTIDTYMDNSKIESKKTIISIKRSLMNTTNGPLPRTL